jgi:hypothetical protein
MRYVRGFSRRRGNTAAASCKLSRVVSWYGWCTPGVSKVRCLGPKGMPGTRNKPRVVPGTGAIVGSHLPPVPPRRFIALISELLPAVGGSKRQQPNRQGVREMHRVSEAMQLEMIKCCSCAPVHCTDQRALARCSVHNMYRADACRERGGLCEGRCIFASYTIGCTKGFKAGPVLNLRAHHPQVCREARYTFKIHRQTEARPLYCIVCPPPTGLPRSPRHIQNT